MENNEEKNENKFRGHKWTPLYFFPIIIGVVTIGILLFLIFGGFSACSNNNISTSLLNAIYNFIK